MGKAACCSAVRTSDQVGLSGLRVPHRAHNMAKALLLFFSSVVALLIWQTRLKFVAKTTWHRQRGGLGTFLFCVAALKPHRNPRRTNCRERSDSTCVCAVATWDRYWVALWVFTESFHEINFIKKQLLCFWQNRTSIINQVDWKPLSWLVCPRSE